MKILKISFSLFWGVMIAGNVYSQMVASFSSPDKSLRMDLLLSNGQMSYTLTKGKQVIIEKSYIQWTINDISLGTQTDKIEKIKKSNQNSTYPTRGTHSLAINKSNNVIFQVTSIDHQAFLLEVKAFNDGVAFRYLADFTGQSEVNDLTAFTLPADTKVWSQGDIQYYEGSYRQQDVDSLKLKQLAGPPVVVKYPQSNLYSAITEGGLYDFAGMALQVSDKRTFKAKLSGKTTKTGKIETPWRIIMVGNLNTLVNSDIITNVSEPPDKELFKDASSWIKPGICVWSWLTDFNIKSKYKVNLEDMKLFSKWAGELGIPYNLVDAGWGHWKDGDKDCWAVMKDLVDYSAKQNVKILLWKGYPDMDSIEGINTPKRWEDFIKRCNEAGVAGMKIDFFNNEGQEITKFYHDALKDAARNKMVIDFHGSNKPTGLSYTFPNEMNREGIQGNEYGVNAARDIILPFTRLLAGPGDYTPLFLNPTIRDFNEPYSLGATSWCHQIASALVFSSPLLCLSANPEDILKNPNRDFICSMPTVWDETIVLPPSEIGELVLMARRSGKDWYITGMTQKPQPGINVSMRFLKKGKYKADIIKDTPAQQNNSLAEEIILTAKDNLSFKMNSNGGFVAKISPE
jgi:alpha-glucosidase